MSVKKAARAFLPVVLMYVLSIGYAYCRLIVMDLFHLPHYDEFRFDANDLTRLYFAILPLLPIAVSVYVSSRNFEGKLKRLVYIGVSALVIFYISSLFANGLMFR